MAALVATASIETSAPLSPSSSARRSIRAGMAVVSYITRLVGHGFLAEHQAGRRREGRDQLQRRRAGRAIRYGQPTPTVPGKVSVPISAGYTTPPLCHPAASANGLVLRHSDYGSLAGWLKGALGLG